LGSRLRIAASANGTSRKGVRHYASRLRELPNAQILQTLGDKFDAGYRVRRHWHRRSGVRQQPVVLLPTAYVNVSRMLIEYAQVVPGAKFLLLATRRSGRVRQVPDNVDQEWLAAYADNAGNGDEHRDISARWAKLKCDLEM